MTVEYADGAEPEVLAALRSAEDVSAGSAELAAHVTSWETAYHFSPARLGLLAPLRLRAGHRAVDLGCGSGVLTRVLGEAGMDVLGIEGAPERAAAARERCRDLPNVTVTAGTITGALSGTGSWDLALMCGVLEYSTRYGDGPRPLLGAVAASLAADGVLVLAIENQLGLRYLLGGAEDHLGAAWVGLADYPSAGAAPNPARTWTRHALAELLAEVGLTRQRWLLPYPDYKLPRLVLDESIFARDDTAELVEKLVRDPLQGSFGGNDAAVSGRIVHRLAVTEGMGARVAPSFLVLAARSAGALERAAEPGLAWLISGSRRAGWRRVRRLDDDLTLRTVHQGHGVPNGWLRQQHPDAEPLWPGRAMDAHLLDAMRAGDLARLGELLDHWRSVCTRDATTDAAHLGTGAAPAAHPYLPQPGTTDVLPADHLDIHPGNLIIGPDGAATRVDLEWLASDGVDAELVMLRALLEFARDAVHNHAPLPWPAATTVRDVLTELCALAGLGDALARRWPELVSAEATLQELVTGRPAAQLAAEIETDAHAQRPAPLWQLAGGLRTLRDAQTAKLHAEQELAAAGAWFADRERTLLKELAEQREHAEELAEQRDLAQHELAIARSDVETKDDRIGLAFAELALVIREAQTAWEANAQAEEARAAVEAERDALRERLARTRTRLDLLEGSRLVRVAHRSLWPAGRLVRGLRDLALARPGDEPDGVLRRAPSFVGRLAGRYRRAAAPSRESGLHFDLPIPATPVVVGAGQAVELTGWVTHAAVEVRTVHVLAGDQRVRARRGYLKPDVAAMLNAGGVRAPSGSGITARIPLRPVEAEAELPLSLLVELDDGTRLTRPLPALHVAPRLDVEPVTVRWPGSGPKVAVCMATYRPDPDFLARQLDSLRAQRHPNWVCVICDDGSDPASVRALRALTAGDERFVVVTNERNAGFYRNFERALALAPADADTIALCDQDDIWDDDKLATLLERLTDPNVTLTYSDMRLIDEHDHVIAETFWRRRHNQWHDLESLLLLNTITGAASMLRAPLVRSHILPFPPGTPSAFHDQWIAAAAMAAGTIAYVDRPLYSYRQHSAAVTGRRDNRLDEDLPAAFGWLPLILRGRGLAPAKDAELEAVAEFELRRVAQFATVLSLRLEDRLPAKVRNALAELATVEDRVRPLLARAARPRPETAGAERYLLAATLRWKALRPSRLRLPSLSSPPID